MTEPTNPEAQVFILRDGALDPVDAPDAHVLVIYPPDEDLMLWTVMGDLRELRDFDERSMNYLVADRLENSEPVDGIISIDPEYSCFFAYARTQVAAEALRDMAEYLARRID